MRTRPSILVGRLWHEGHSFNPVPTRRADFHVTKGDVLIADARGGNTALSGIIHAGEAANIRLLPSLSAYARPGGAVEEYVYQSFKSAFVDHARCGGFDAVCLELHGATIAAEMPDTEGDLLGALRDMLGPDMPICVALDLHGHVTEAMVAAATYVTGYRTNPHSDMAETGERAMRRAIDCVSGARPLHPHRIRLPFVTRGNDETDRGPLLEIARLAHELRGQPDIIDVSIFNVHPFIDVPDLGQVVLAYGATAASAKVAAHSVASALWHARKRFEEALPSPAEVIRAGHYPLVLGDQGDRVLGGGPGDSVFIAQFCRDAFPALRVAAPVYDPDAVRAAQQAGEGATFSHALGGSVTSITPPIDGSWTVARLGRATFVNRGPYMAGVAADLGDYAILRDGNLTLIATNRAPNVHDPQAFEALNVVVGDQHVLVAKSGNHYKLSFAGVARAVTVDTPGLTAFRPQDFPFRQARPIYPLDDVDWP